ncbi:MAG: 4Fe-4S binding protein [Candidatus Omnitrophica bacterium]|nr:4Fe-4S binding protein [Candidatus Omnitrophota bacterium]
MKKLTYKILFLIITVSLFVFPSQNTSEASEFITKSDLAEVLPAANIFVREEEPFGHFMGYRSNGGEFVGVVFLTTEVVPEESWGYRDMIYTLVGVDAKGRITGVKIIEENETPKYTRGLLNEGSWFLDQFIGKDITDGFSLGIDVDAITGATISSSTISRSIETALKLVTEQVLFYGDADSANPVRHVLLHHLLWQIDFIVLWIIVGLAFCAFFSKSKQLRYLVLGVSIVYIGFLKGGGFSVYDILNLLSFNLPVFINNLYWYSLLFFAIGLTIFAGRFYCGWLCPFGSVLEVVHKIVPYEIKVPVKIDRSLRLVKYFILVFILIIFLMFVNKNLAIFIIGIIEPFATFFKMYGEPIVWIWVITVLIVSACISRFYCKYVCPLGAFFALLSRLSERLGLRKLNVILPNGKCTGCRKAENNCQMNAVEYNEKEKRPIINNEECFMCNTCVDMCPTTGGKKDIKNESRDNI